MRLIMMGTGPFAVPTFRRLYEARHDVALLVTRRPESSGGGGRAGRAQMRDIAHEHATPIYDPENINAAAEAQQLADVGADLLVVCDYGQILAPKTLATARLGGINLHGSLLPKYRGAAPIQLGLAQRRYGDGRDRDPHDAARSMPAPASPRRSRRSMRKKRPSSWRPGWPNRAALVRRDDRRPG